MKQFSLVAAACVLMLSCVATPALAQRGGLERELRINGDRVTAAFHPVVAATRASTVTILDGEKAVALGAVVAADGYVLTKLSELPAAPTIVLAGGNAHAATVVEKNQANDLVLLRIDADGLSPVEWGDSSRVEMGNFIVTAWPAKRDADAARTRVGVVSANRRKIARTGGVIGVTLGQRSGEQGGIVVAQVVPDSGAAAAGLKANDIILAVNGKVVEARRDLIRTVTSHDPGETIKVKFQRDDEQQEVDVMLGHRSVVFNMFSRNQRMSGATSKRRAGFDAIIQHDTPLGPDAMGGPIVDLTGQVIGINIARANRSETFALPADLVEPIVQAMITDARGE